MIESMVDVATVCDRVSSVLHAALKEMTRWIRTFGETPGHDK